MILDTNFKRGLLAIVGCLLVDASVGEYNLLSFLYPYYGSYFHYKDRKITVDDTPLLGAIWLIPQAFAIVGVWVNGYLGFRWTFTFFVVFFCTCQFVSSYIENFYLFILVYALPGGLAQGALVILPLYCAWQYFPPHYKGRISGIILSAYALAPVIFANVSSKIVNPDNVDVIELDGHKYFPENVANNVPTFIRTFCVICLGAGLLGVGMILDPIPQEEAKISEKDGTITEEKSELKDNLIERDSVSQKQEPVVTIAVPKLTWQNFKEVIQNKFFWQAYFCMTIGYTYCHFVNFSFKKIGLNHLHKADRYINIIGSVAAVFNALARPLAALLFEKISYRFVAYSIMIMQIISALTFIYAADDKVTYGVSLCFYFVTYGGQLGLYPLVCEALFPKKGAIVYSCAFSGFCFGALIVGLTYKKLLDSVGETSLFYGLACVPLLAAYSIHVVHNKLVEGKSKE